MAKQGDKITNVRTGQKMIFLQTGKETNGQLLEIKSFNPPSQLIMGYALIWALVLIARAQAERARPIPR